MHVVVTRTLLPCRLGMRPVIFGTYTAVILSILLPSDVVEIQDVVTVCKVHLVHNFVALGL